MGDLLLFVLLAFIFCVFSAQKSHVKSKIHLTHSTKRKVGILVRLKPLYLEKNKQAPQEYESLPRLTRLFAKFSGNSFVMTFLQTSTPSKALIVGYLLPGNGGYPPEESF
jgi:hypothetical protein